MYYKLITDRYTGKEENIGMIMDSFIRELSNLTGLSLGIYMGPTSEEIVAYYEGQEMSVILEEVLWKNMSCNERVNKIVEYIEKIDGVGKDLLIIDPYFFSGKLDIDYINLVASIFTKSACNKLRFITDKKNFNPKLYNEIKEKIESDIEISYSSDFHDRFWIANRSKGFNSGTSLNGVGKKISSIYMLEDDDVRDIINEVDKIE